MNKNMCKRWRKSTILLVSMFLILGIAVSSTVAYLVTQTTKVTNTFTPSVVTTEVVEEGENSNTKTNVKIKNTGDTTAYIRAAVAITWQDENGNILGQIPEAGTDYRITWSTDGWEKSLDGFYYYKSPVRSVVESSNDCYTNVLITECKPLKAAPVAGYYLAVEIISSGIQSNPTSVVTTEWSSGVNTIDTDGSTLVIKTP